MQPATSSNRGRPGYSRGQVIQMAVEEFNAHGYEATSMGTLAKVMGISKSAIYHHVTSKEQILQEATDLALHELQVAIQDAYEYSQNAHTRLRHAIRGSVKVLCNNRAHVTLLLRLRGNSEVELAAMEKRRNLTKTMVELVKQAQHEGTLRTDLDPGLTGRIIFGTINSISDWYEPDGKFTPEEIADRILDLFAFGARNSS